MKNVTLTAIIKAWPEHTETLKDALTQLVKGSLAEAACLQYDLYQAAYEPNLFIFHEIWESEAALEQHNNAPHVQQFIETSAPLLLEPVTIYSTNKL